MRDWCKRWWWLLSKLLLAVAILLAVGRRFYLDLHELDLDQVSLRPGWLLLSAVLYVLALGFSCGYWYFLLLVVGDRPRVIATIRAYYLGHLGKYVPGKAWALLLRSALIRGPQVRLGTAALTATYEVLTTMAAAALLAAGIFLFSTHPVSGLPYHPVLLGLLLLGLVGVPLLPGVFNRLVGGLKARFQQVESFRLPPLRAGTLARGLLATGCGWTVMGVSLWAALWAVLPQPPPLTGIIWAHAIASLGLAYVAGFLAIVVPGGVGVREFFLLQLLGPLAAEPHIAVAVLVTRLLWTAAELVLAAVLFWLPGSPLPKDPLSPKKETG